MYATFHLKVALVEDISKNGTTILQLVAAKDLCMEAVVAMEIASVLWRSVKPSVFIVKNYFLVAMTQLYLIKVLSFRLCTLRIRTRIMMIKITGCWAVMPCGWSFFIVHQST